MTIIEKLPKLCLFFTLTFKLKLLRETALCTMCASSIFIQLTQDGIIGRVHSRFEFMVSHSNLIMYNFGH